MTLHLTIDLRAVILGFVLLLVAAGVATPFAISLADDEPSGETSSAQAIALGTAFTYQGRLETDGVPANGAYDFQVLLREDPNGLASVPGTGALLLQDVAVTNGLFTVDLDFLVPAAFNGQERWLDIRVRPGVETGGFTPMTPLQRLAPAPYALFASAAPWSGITGKPAGLDDGDQDTLYTAVPGSGITLAVNAFGSDPAVLQRRVRLDELVPKRSVSRQIRTDTSCCAHLAALSSTLPSISKASPSSIRQLKSGAQSSVKTSFLSA